MKDSSDAGPSWLQDEIRPGGAESQSLLAPGLYVTATPIGNARDITLRALDVLRGCDVIAAEDTRVTAKLLAIHGIKKPLTVYNDHNAARERPKLLRRLREGARIALVSDAGTPLISDPGHKLVREAVAEGVAVHAIPGASAALAALTLAGLPTDRFLFAGFLPPKSGARRTVLTALRDARATLIFYESPHRLGESLSDMEAVLGMREAVVARELTKRFEEVRRGDLASLATDYAKGDTPKGEITIVVASAPEAAPDLARADEMLGKALEFMPVRAAVDLLAEALDLPRHALYERALARKKDS
ncbi:MAG TPA: 16S rRNA (cytidine(1402)-2'-O)-methyltransferase [Rhizomicrobium sp.]|nr:16S rRNA (cytidine(1402)-2'-O)-methyltransferase [Rhizomicrobium sp.]